MTIYMKIRSFQMVINAINSSLKQDYGYLIHFLDTYESATSLPQETKNLNHFKKESLQLAFNTHVYCSFNSL